MMSVRKMTIADIAVLKLPEQWMRDRYEMYLDAGTGPAWIMEDNGRPLCAFGAAFLWDGVCEVWFNLIEKTNTIGQIRAAKRYLLEQGKKYKVRRFHATIKCDSKISSRFVEALGFKCETPNGMKNYNPDGSTAYLYSRIIE